MTSYGKDEDESVDPTSFKGLLLHPCFRTSILTSMGAGSLMMAYAAVTRKAPRTIATYFVYSTLAVASGVWPMCRVQEQKRKKEIKRFMGEQVDAVNEEIREKLKTAKKQVKD